MSLMRNRQDNVEDAARAARMAKANANRYVLYRRLMRERGLPFPEMTRKEFSNEELSMSIFKSMDAALSRGKEDNEILIPEDSSRFPSLLTALVEEKDGKGAPRDRSVLLLSVEDGMWKCGLLCKSEGLSLWRSGETLLGALEALETEASSDAPEWRKMKNGPTRRTGQKGR